MAKSKKKAPVNDTNQRRYTLAGGENAARDAESVYMDFCQRKADLLRRCDSQISAWTKLRSSVANVDK